MGDSGDTNRGDEVRSVMKKILILTSNPRHDLKLDREIKDLKNVIKRSKNQSQFKTEFELEVRPEELQELLLEHEPRIVHFCGHGTGEQGLVLENRAGKEQIISTEALSNLFGLFDKSCECVILNACYSEVQARAIVEHINYVVGMSHEIKDDAAIAFATGFYRALGWGKTIEEAYQFGRSAIQIQLSQNNTSRSRSGTVRKMAVADTVERVNIPEDLKPVLKQKSPLTPFPESATATSPKSDFPPELIAAVKEEENYKQYRERARETWDEFGQSPAIERESISQNEYRQRKTLVNKVKQFWIEGFLKPSLYANSAINLDWQNSPDAVLRPFEGMADIPVELDESFEELQSTEILNQTGQGNTLLILGDPGSGKTITLLQLAEKLVAQSEADLTKPIPVVFNLSSWGQKQQPIDKWLMEEFKDKYQVPKTWSEPWLAQEQLILLLDGLDEVELVKRDACVRALNQFIATHNVTEIVVCSRVKDYQALTERLQLSSALCIKPLSSQQVYSFLTKAGDSLAGVKTLLQQDRELEQFAQTPLILNIMSMAYQGWSAEKLLQQFRTSQDRYRHLFDSYIERMLNRPQRGQSERVQYPKEKVLHWLSWLAKTMVDESRIIFLIEKMQPSLLESRGKNRAYRIWNFLMGGLIGGLVGGLVGELSYWLPSYWLLSFMLIGVLIGGLITSVSKEIVLFEQISWSWHSAKSKFVRQMTLGVIIGLILGLMFMGISFYEWRELYEPITANSTELNSNYYEPYIAELNQEKAELNQKKAEQKTKMSKAQNAEVKAFYQNKLEQTNNELNQLNHDLILFEDEEFKDEKLNQDLSLKEELLDWWLWYSIKELLLIPVLIGGLIGGINSGFNSKEMKQRTLPNQGIWSSGKSALKIMVIVALIVASIGGAIGGLIIKKYIDFELLKTEQYISKYDQEIDKIEKIIRKAQNADVKVDLQKRLRKKNDERTELKNDRDEKNNNIMGILVSELLSGGLFGGLFGVLILGQIVGLLNGGATCIQHFNLRRFLYRQGRIPWNYARFLDYATERLLMKKVGGGYVFYHRMLMEHFAQRHQAFREPFPVALRQTARSVAQVNTANTNVKVSSGNTKVPVSTVTRNDRPIPDRIFCSSCGRQNPASGKFCIDCGTKLVKPS